MVAVVVVVSVRASVVYWIGSGFSFRVRPLMVSLLFKSEVHGYHILIALSTYFHDRYPCSIRIR